MSSSAKKSSKQESSHQDSRPVLQASRKANRQVDRPQPAPVRPAWREKELKAASSLPEESWPVPVPSKEGRPNLGLSLQGKLGASKERVDSSKVGDKRILADPPTCSPQARQKEEKENLVSASADQKVLSSQQKRRRHYRRMRASRKRQADEAGSDLEPKVAKKQDLRDHLNGKVGSGAVKHQTVGSGVAKHQTVGTGAAKHQSGGTGVAKHLSGGSGAAKHQKGGSGAAKHQKGGSGVAKHQMDGEQRGAAKQLSELGTGAKQRPGDGSGAGAANVHQKSTVPSTNRSRFTLTVSGSRLISPELLPDDCYQIKDGQVVYKWGDLQLSFPQEYQADRVSRDITHPTRPTHIVGRLDQPTLLIPAEQMPKEATSHPRMLLLPQLKAASHHATEGQACGCTKHNRLERFHREAILPDTCLKGRLPSEEDWQVGALEDQFQENPAHFYLADSRDGDAYLGVPAPFLLGGTWPRLKYEPVLAKRSSGQQVAQYLALYNVDRFNRVADQHQRCPRELHPRNSLVISEASTSNEVGLVAERLYGLETIPRIGFTAHPASEPAIHLYPAMDMTTRKVPVFVQDSRHPAVFDGMMGDLFRPFWEKGHGLILCAICLFTEKEDGKAHPSYWSRQHYISHWEKHHYSSYVVSSTFSATQLHTRVYMGHLLYTLALACRKMGEEDPLRMAINLRALTQYNIKATSNTLALLYPPPKEDDNSEVEEVAKVTVDESGNLVEKASRPEMSTRELLEGARANINDFWRSKNECSAILQSLEDMMGEEMVRKVCGEDVAPGGADHPVSLEAALKEVIAGHPASLGEKLSNVEAGHPASSVAARGGAGHPASLGEKLPHVAAGQPASSVAVPMEVDTAEGPGQFLVSQEDVQAALMDYLQDEEEPFVLVKAKHKRGSKKK